MPGKFVGSNRCIESSQHDADASVAPDSGLNVFNVLNEHKPVYSNSTHEIASNTDGIDTYYWFRVMSVCTFRTDSDRPCEGVVTSMRRQLMPHAARIDNSPCYTKCAVVMLSVGATTVQAPISAVRLARRFLCWTALDCPE